MHHVKFTPIPCSPFTYCIIENIYTSVAESTENFSLKLSEWKSTNDR